MAQPSISYPLQAFRYFLWLNQNPATDTPAFGTALVLALREGYIFSFCVLDIEFLETPCSANGASVASSTSHHEHLDSATKSLTSLGFF